MGGEYICVTGCIIAQLTHAWIEPFQPNNPSGHHQNIYHTMYKLHIVCVFVCDAFQGAVFTLPNTHFIRSHTEVEPLQTNSSSMFTVRHIIYVYVLFNNHMSNLYEYTITNTPLINLSIL